MSKPPTKTKKQLEAEALPPAPPAMKGLPKGFTPHDGKKCPVESEDARVVLVIRTSEGLGFSGPIRAREHEWTRKSGTLGCIVGWRLALLDDQLSPPDRYLRWPE